MSPFIAMCLPLTKTNQRPSQVSCSLRGVATRAAIETYKLSTRGGKEGTTCYGTMITRILWTGPQHMFEDCFCVPLPRAPSAPQPPSLGSLPRHPRKSNSEDEASLKLAPPLRSPVGPATREPDPKLKSGRSSSMRKSAWFFGISPCSTSYVVLANSRSDCGRWSVVEESQVVS